LPLSHNGKTFPTLALIEVIDNLIQNMENGNISVGIYLDLQKAFDTVNHQILLAKMNNYGVRVQSTIGLPVI